ncbi:Fe-S oxidoreductase [Desulfotomaculum arcticum]|uniref:Fe-S oxidoreductase n=1 Tax=Desulfotruncus arcticus DSM 17038 TaxID=1121424 RepID=A0A1I2U7P2_9FIRM|nr:(Fe-S)-binding protein [Desulfotruncus arcticus]SFG70856.1 Fe-S oxidoreductase [Desulfotomaculum arcticum] [Desulfotruncus arcticus DSM 17038]
MSVIFANKLDPNFMHEVVSKACTTSDREQFYNCLSCGMCSAGCPYNGVHENADPRKFIRMLTLGMRDEVLNSEFIWACTQCGRCTSECPMGVEVLTLVRTIRGNFGLKAPGFLQDVVDAQIKTGNQMEVSTEDYLDTLEWMEEELQEEVGDPNAKIPIDKEGADFLFLWDPREIKYYPNDVQSLAKIMWYVGADWTCSSKWWDATHYALFNGNDEESRIITQRYADEVKRLKVKELVITECGHATHANKWGPKVWLEKDNTYPVKSIVEKYVEWFEAGLLHVDPSVNTEPITLHDPCNSVRKQGLGDAMRYVLNKTVTEFREMNPHGVMNYCCGGGGGLLAMGKDIYPYRMAKGKLKADQIKDTGCNLVACPCHNCFDQLTDIIKYYELDAKVIHLHHLISHALIMDKKPQK